MKTRRYYPRVLLSQPQSLETYYCRICTASYGLCIQHKLAVQRFCTRHFALSLPSHTPFDVIAGKMVARIHSVQTCALSPFTSRATRFPIMSPCFRQGTTAMYIRGTFLSISHCKVNLSLRLTNYALRHEGVWESGCIDPHFLELDISWVWVVGFTLRPLYHRR
jgi:hypothetical protein